MHFLENVKVNCGADPSSKNILNKEKKNVALQHDSVYDGKYEVLICGAVML